MCPLPILIAGPTASGKSSLATRLASATNGVVVNTDALQVYENWQILTARPNANDINDVQHALYGHVAKETEYSVGAWLRDLETLVINQFPERQLILVGGTGLYFSSATNGLAEIPPTPSNIRATGDMHRKASGTAFFLDELQNLDPEILKTIDRNNAVRLQRAWEVVTATKKALSAWQSEPTVPLIPNESSIRIILSLPKEQLRTKIDTRFDWMLENGALDECRAAIESGWNPDLPSSRALGASELVAYLQNEISLEEATTRAKTATHRYAKRQRTWFRRKMSDWHQVTSETTVSQILDLPPK